MNANTNSFIKLSTLLIFGFIFWILMTVGCATTLPQEEKTGAMLWGENCNRCHNIRTPSEFNDGQWEVAMTHMRTRGNLTANESKKILEFLKVAN
ncbi:MAG: cytochrome c [Calditrichaeota bacterium]|nr:MAG: cytochrome c [Calditrichota bacterium]